MEKDIKNTYMTKALTWLSKRAYTERELAEKFRKLPEYSPEAAEMVVADCVRLGFLNDAMYAADYANILAARGCGFYRLKMNMKNKGLDGGHIEAALAEVSTPEAELERAVNAGQYKLRLLKKDETFQKKREKLYRFLMTRGFKSDIVRIAMAKLLQADSSDDADDFNEF